MALAGRAACQLRRVPNVSEYEHKDSRWEYTIVICVIADTLVIELTPSEVVKYILYIVTELGKCLQSNKKMYF